MDFNLTEEQKMICDAMRKFAQKELAPIAERLDRGYHAFRDCRAHIGRPPSEYLKRFYYDTVNFDHAALRLAVAFAGVDHVLAGSDYPHQIGSIATFSNCMQVSAILFLTSPVPICMAMKAFKKLATAL